MRDARGHPVVRNNSVRVLFALFCCVITERHLRRILTVWVLHYNGGRPHSSLGPGIPDLPEKPSPYANTRRHRIPPDCRIRNKDALSGLHHEYWLEQDAA
jgi:hypothetical protein